MIAPQALPYLQSRCWWPRTLIPSNGRSKLQYVLLPLGRTRKWHHYVTWYCDVTALGTVVVNYAHFHTSQALALDLQVSFRNMYSLFFLWSEFCLLSSLKLIPNVQIVIFKPSSFSSWLWMCDLKWDFRCWVVVMSCLLKLRQMGIIAQESREIVWSLHAFLMLPSDMFTAASRKQLVGLCLLQSNDESFWICYELFNPENLNINITFTLKKNSPSLTFGRSWCKAKAHQNSKLFNMFFSRHVFWTVV